MRLGTLNVKSNPLMRQSKVEHDIRKMLHMSGVVLWQEIAPKRYTHVLTAAHAFGHAGTGYEVPITWDKRNFRYVDSGAVRTHGGRSHITPSRYISWVILEFGGTRAVFMNSHTVSSAWSGRRVAQILWRRKMWNKHFAVWHDLVGHFAEQGYTVFGGGDLNRNNTKAFYPGMRWLEHTGYDNIFVVEGSKGPKVWKSRANYRSRKGEFYTDHPAKVVYLRYTK